MSSSGSLVAAAFTALGLSAILAIPAGRLARRYGLTDRPAPHKAHREPTPYLGGATIVIATLVPTVLVARPWATHLWLVGSAAVAVAVLGLIDDMRGLSARTRLVVEIALAGALTAGGVQLGIPGPRWLDVVLTVAWIVGITNSFNLLDNADGALAVVACVTALPVAASALLSGQTHMGVLLVCLSMACGGFLLHNAPPARIFLGDAGSLFIGLLIATATADVGVTVPPDLFSRASVLLLVAFVAVADTSLVVVSRRLHHRPVCRGGTDHAAHRLRRLGLGAEGVLGVLLLVAATCGALSALVRGGLLPGSTALIGVTAALIGSVALLLRSPGYPDAVSAPPSAATPEPLPRNHTLSRG